MTCHFGEVFFTGKMPPKKKDDDPGLPCTSTAKNSWGGGAQGGIPGGVMVVIIRICRGHLKAKDDTTTLQYS